MKIYKGSITNLAECGYLTLQVPNCEIISGGTPSTTEEVPDEWLVYLKNDRPVHPRESGFLFLTRKGYEANKDKLRAALEKSMASGRDRTQGQGWKAFEQEAEKHFKTVEASIAKYRQYLKKKLEESKTWKV